jgi:hypothetical protein
MKITKITIDADATAKVFVITTKSEDSKYAWIETVCYDSWFTGWDLTDDGFYMNFDMSLDCVPSEFDSTEDYKEYIINNIAEYVPVKFDKAIVIA